MNWILNLIGIIIFFVNRYFGREVKTTGFSWSYWWRDNWQEVITILLINLALMIIMHMKETRLAIDQLMAQLPAWVKILGVPGICLGLGLGLSWLIYQLFVKKVEEAKK